MATPITVLVQNSNDIPLRIPRNFRLGHIVELEYPNAFDAEATVQSQLT